MGAPPPPIRHMFALYSKAFAKGAVDLNKNDFYDGYGHKLKAKANHNGVGFELNASDKTAANDADVKVDVPVDEHFTVSLKTTANQDTEVTAALKASDAATVKVTAKNFDLGFATTQITGEFTYLDPAFSVEGKFGAFDGAKCLTTEGEGDKATTKFSCATGTLGMSAAFALACPFAEDITIGFQPALGYGADKAPVVNMPFSVGGGNKDFQLAFTGGFVLDDKSPALASGGLKGLYKIADDLKVAFEVEQVKYKMERDIYKDCRKKTGAENESFTFKVGGEYTVSDKTSMKGKYTYAHGKEASFDLVFKTALEGKCNATAAVKFGKKEPSVGFTYNLEY